MLFKRFGLIVLMLLPVLGLAQSQTAQLRSASYGSMAMSQVVGWRCDTWTQCKTIVDQVFSLDIELVKDPVIKSHLETRKTRLLNFLGDTYRRTQDIQDLLRKHGQYPKGQLAHPGVSPIQDIDAEIESVATFIAAQIKVQTDLKVQLAGETDLDKKKDLLTQIILNDTEILKKYFELFFNIFTFKPSFDANDLTDEGIKRSGRAIGIGITIFLVILVGNLSFDAILTLFQSPFDTESLIMSRETMLAVGLGSLVAGTTPYLVNRHGVTSADENNSLIRTRVNQIEDLTLHRIRKFWELLREKLKTQNIVVPELTDYSPENVAKEFIHHFSRIPCVDILAGS